VPVLGVHLAEKVSLLEAQLIYLTLAERFNDRKIFFEGLILETSLVNTHNERLSFQNLVVLKRTISSLVSSIIVRFDSNALASKEVFKLSFTRGIKPPWVIGFSFEGPTELNWVEQAAYQCSGIE
jgi:hypothetical protein